MTAPHNELVTLRDWLRWAVSRFAEARLTFGHGTTNGYDEACYLLQKLFRTQLGTNNIDCCARVCHASTAAALRLTTGAAAASACCNSPPTRSLSSSTTFMPSPSRRCCATFQRR